MATITEDYVSFEIAKLLKEKGFDEPCYMAYVPTHKEYMMRNDTGHSNSMHPADYYTAPTLQMTRKWLEKIHGIYLNIIYIRICDKGYWGKGHWTWDNEEYNSYEEASEAAIKYSLENLI